MLTDKTPVIQLTHTTFSTLEEIMKLTKAEKIWLAVVVIFYILYNLPFFPKYYMPKATIIHMLITIIPLWIAIYIGFFKICRGKKNKNKEDKTC